jgi:glucosamine-6-phosphate deaminase
MSAAAAADVAGRLRRAIAGRGTARVVAATAASQLEFQRELVRAPDIAWSQVELFQLDEYIGLPAGHPASFKRLLLQHLIEPTGIARFHLIGDGDPPAICAALNAALARADIDIAVLGIGENAHLAFNDPPADFDAQDPYIIVTLDEACRRQQVGEGWFPRLEDVPARAISMSIRQMLRARELVVIVPDERKAAAVKATLEAEMSPHVPASILRTHENVTLYLDEAAASMLDAAVRVALERGIGDRRPAAD